MPYEVNARAVKGVAYEASKAVSGMNFDNVEVILGLSELIGRIIVATAESHIQYDEMLGVAQQHMVRTIRAGAEAQGKGNVIAGL